MAEYAREPTSDEQLRTLQDQVRRLWTRIPASGAPAVQTFSVPDSLVNHAGGWYVDGYPYPTFVRQGGLVSFNGLFACFSPNLGVGSPNVILFAGVIPPEFCPHRQTRIRAIGKGFTDDRLWMCYLEPTGMLQLASMHTAGAFGHPDLAWGRVTDDVDMYLSFDSVYPAADLELGEYTA